MNSTAADPVITVARLVDECGVGVTVERVLRAGDKSVLALGHCRQRRVVIKACLSDEQFWRAKFDHEIGIYQEFNTSAPPVRVPKLIHAVPGRVIVIEYIPGHVVDTQRYPTDPLTPVVLDAVLDTVVGFGRWKPPASALSAVFDYPDRVDRYHRAGIFDDTDRRALHRLIDDVGPIDAVCHGDPLPSNLLIDDDGHCVPVDFEFTGLFAAGFDLAMAHTLLAATPGAQELIEAIVAEADIEAAFLLNRAMVVSREYRLHTELPAGGVREDRLALIGTQFDAMRSHLHHRQRG